MPGPGSNYFCSDPVFLSKHNDPFTAYVEMGSPNQLTRVQVEALKKISCGEPASQDVIAITDGHFSQSMPLRTNDCYQVVLTPVKNSR